MAKIMDTIKKYWLFGALIGALLPWALTIISKIPGIVVTASTISLNVANVNTGLAAWAFNVFGANIGLPEMLLSALGGILFIALGIVIVDILNLEKVLGLKTKTSKLATTIFVASLVSGWIMDMSLGIPGIAVIVSNVIGAVALAFILITLDNTLKLKLIPN